MVSDHDFLSILKSKQRSFLEPDTVLQIRLRSYQSIRIEKWPPHLYMKIFNLFILLHIRNFYTLNPNSRK